MWSMLLTVLFASFRVTTTLAQPYPSGSGHYDGQYFEIQNYGSNRIQNQKVHVANDYFGVDPNTYEAKLLPAASFSNNYSSFDNYFYEYYPYGDNGQQYGGYHGAFQVTWRPVFESCRYPFFQEVFTARVFDLFKIVYSATDPSGRGPVFFGFNCSIGTGCQSSNRTVYVYDQNGTTYTSSRDADDSIPRGADLPSYWYLQPDPVDSHPVPADPAYSMSLNWYQNGDYGGVGSPSSYTLGTQSCACSSGGCGATTSSSSSSSVYVNPSTYTYTITTHSTSIFTTSGYTTTSVLGTTYTTAFDSSEASSWSSKVIMVSTRQASHSASLASIRSSKTLAASISRASLRSKVGVSKSLAGESRASAHVAASISHDSARSRVAVSKSLASESRQSARSAVSVSKSLASVSRQSARSVVSVSKASRIASYDFAHSITTRGEPTKEEKALITLAPPPRNQL